MHEASQPPPGPVGFDDGRSFVRENAEAIRQNRKLMEAILAELSAARREAHTWWRAIFGTRIPPLVFLREMKRSRVKGAKTRRRGRPKS